MNHAKASVNRKKRNYFSIRTFIFFRSPRCLRSENNHHRNPFSSLRSLKRGEHGASQITMEMGREAGIRTE